MQALDRWEERLEALFDGRPYDILDAALTDTVARFPVHIQVAILFRTDKPVGLTLKLCRKEVCYFQNKVEEVMLQIPILVDGSCAMA